LTASTDEINAGCKARVERRKVSEGADEASPPECQWEVRRERGRAWIAGCWCESRHLRLKLANLWRDSSYVARFHIFIARFHQSRNQEGAVDGKPPRRKPEIYDISITERFLSGSILCVK
jgi:hypothetical protein